LTFYLNCNIVSVYSVYNVYKSSAEVITISNFDSLDGIAYNRIKQMIIDQDIQAGEIINQSKLSEQIGVSRTPLRQALSALEGEGLLLKSPRGWYAREFTIQDMITVYEVRVLLEGLCCRMATPKFTPAQLAYMKTLITSAFEQYENGSYEPYYKADIEFHNMIIDATKDSILKATIDSTKIISTSHMITISPIKGQTESGQKFSLQDPKQSFEDHMELIQAFEQKDAQLAETIMRQHIQRALNKLKSLV
jgi:DNA-binding GntR family transcriptional regulator